MYRGDVAELRSQVDTLQLQLKAAREAEEGLTTSAAEGAKALEAAHNEAAALQAQLQSAEQAAAKQEVLLEDAKAEAQELRRQLAEADAAHHLTEQLGSPEVSHSTQHGRTFTLTVPSHTHASRKQAHTAKR